MAAPSRTWGRRACCRLCAVAASGSRTASQAVATSLGVSGIWEKIGTSVTAGSTYKVRANGYNVSGTQTVYMAAIAN